MEFNFVSFWNTSCVHVSLPLWQSSAYQLGKEKIVVNFLWFIWDLIMRIF